MDFRSSQQQPVAHPATPVTAGSPTNNRQDEQKTRGRGSGNSDNRWLRWLNVIILFGVVILIIFMIFAFTRGNGNEAKFVNAGKDKYQAVFLNNGQVYFGQISSLNNSYIQLNDIYYLTQNNGNSSPNNSTANSNYTLVKLGCQQIHDPTDQMIINMSQVSFWENLNAGGKVVKSINQYQKQNPNGPDCSQTSTQTQSSSNTNTQNAANPTDNNKQPSNKK